MKIDNSINLSNTNELNQKNKQQLKPTTDQKVDFAATLESEMKLMNGGGGHPVKDKKPQ
ncbi:MULTISPECIES: hypothetical protein [Pseudoalteromonas]|uniref:hypothetical protein n=1 Tax=Pseudoalteromonas TaxID=53246 RepID=UPI0002D8970F|nr:MULTISPECIES: hypothetical protein [Pseudoalteromonas]MCF6145230.1 hypothetical protein [Pseudoalteromonas mariniglutinosa NCIMB 1770]